MPDFKKLKGHVDNLSLLLDDPQEGLQSWCMLVASEWKKISFLWTGPSDKTVDSPDKNIMAGPSDEPVNNLTKNMEV